MNTKQVIVIRKDLKMRRGKEIAQGAHAAMAWLSTRMSPTNFLNNVSGEMEYSLWLSEPERNWIDGDFTKITCRVDSEEELLDIYQKACEAQLEVNLIEDKGLTEFGGIPTKTCLAIGPDKAKNIDPITKHLKLY